MSDEGHVFPLIGHFCPAPVCFEIYSDAETYADGICKILKRIDDGYRRHGVFADLCDEKLSTIFYSELTSMDITIGSAIFRTNGNIGFSFMND